MKNRLVLIGACGLMLAGCATSPAPAAVPKPAPSPSDSSASVQQWASIVAEEQAELAKWRDQWNADNCKLAAVDDLTCSIETLTGTFVVQTVSTKLKIPTTAKSTGFIGTPPKEIRGLYGDTQTMAEGAVTAGKAWSDGCSKTASDECLQLVFEFDTAVEKLETKFAAWAPYQ